LAGFTSSQGCFEESRMIPAKPVLAAVALLALVACNKTDTAPIPAHNDVATSMPDAAATPGAVGPGASAPHAPTPPDAKLSDPTPPATGPSPTANPADHPN
jgi:hypothetical protein